MSQELSGMIRHILTAIGGYFVAKGKLDPGTLETLVGGFLAVVGFVWSWVAKKQA